MYRLFLLQNTKVVRKNFWHLVLLFAAKTIIQLTIYPRGLLAINSYIVACAPPRALRWHKFSLGRASEENVGGIRELEVEKTIWWRYGLEAAQLSCFTPVNQYVLIRVVRYINT